MVAGRSRRRADGDADVAASPSGDSPISSGAVRPAAFCVFCFLVYAPVQTERTGEPCAG